MINEFNTKSEKPKKGKLEAPERSEKSAADVQRGQEAINMEELVADVVLAEVPGVTRDDLFSIYPSVSRDVVQARDVIIAVLHTLTGADANTISAAAGRLPQDVPNAFKRMRDPNDSARRDLLQRVCDRLEIDARHVISALG